ncbi:MAG: membrane protein insertion efficiency factor YidD [Bullifex sp.]
MKLLREIFLIPVHFYRLFISPMMGMGKCRYTPSCSEYFLGCVRKHGIIRGTILGTARILRCRKSFLGGPDEVPESFSFENIRRDYIIYRKPKDYS